MTLLSNSSFFVTPSCALSAQVAGLTLKDTIGNFFPFYSIVVCALSVCVGIFPKSWESGILWLDF